MITDYVAYWNLNELSGNVSDSSGNNYTGTNFSTTVVDGKISGNARRFASGQYISFGNVLNFTDTQPFSVSLWFKDTVTVTGILIGKGSSPGWELHARAAADSGILRFLYTSAGLTDAVDSTRTGLNDGNWHHVVASRDGTDGTGMNLYIDSISGSTVSFNDNATDATNTKILTLGSREGVSNFYVGDIDEVRVFNRVVTSTEVNQLFLFGQQRFNNIGIRPRPFAPGLAR